MVRGLFRVWVIASLFAFQSVLPASADGLGVGVKPLPKYIEKDKAGLSNNSRLWFVVEPGSSENREILLSGSDIQQRVNLEIVGATETNGEFSLNSTPSPLGKFFEFSENDFILGAGENKVIQLTLRAPLATPSQSANAFLTVTVAGENPKANNKDKNGSVSAVVKNQIRTALRMFIGIGTFQDFYTDFSINDVKDYSQGGNKYFDIFIENTGKTPITPLGDLTLASLDFPGLRFGPFSYLTLSIEPGEVGRFKLRVPDEIQPGNWQVLVKARQGDIIRTKIFEKNLKFREGVDWLNIFFRISAIFGSLLLFWVLRKNFRFERKRKARIDDSPELRKSRRFSRLGGKRRESFERLDESFPRDFLSSFQFELDEILTAGKKTAGKKTAGKKTAGKKTAGKKTAGKKTAGKKTAGKKTAGKKTAGKKTAGKKTA